MTTTESAPRHDLGPTMQGEVRPDLHPIGVNHLAIATTDMKAQLTYWAEVLGCPTKALYWMHGVEGTYHGFVELSPQSYVAFVQHPKNPTGIEYGVTHAGNPGGPVAGGATQHIALHVDTLDEVLAMRDRIRSNGIQVMGPIDHGFCQSIYFAGLEGLSLEVVCGEAIDERQWIDPEVQELCGISADELDALKAPRPRTPTDEPVPQPPFDPRLPQMEFGAPGLGERIMARSDADTWNDASVTDPPVPLAD
jgi:catechol 2,3-dioxygenase-like lactoylglutathione lyase family enzyme